MDRNRPTQVGWALKQLGIRHIAADAPEARGRSKRMFAMLQDHLDKELTEAGITTIAAANRLSWSANIVDAIAEGIASTAMKAKLQGWRASEPPWRRSWR